MKISPDDLEFIRKVLRTHLPAECRVFAYGSRVSGGSKKYSDFDLYVEGPVPVEFKTMECIREVFSNSALSFKVDLSDSHSLSNDFLEKIQRSKVQIL